MARLSLAFLISGVLWLCCGQTPPAGARPFDSEVYEAFFRQIDALHSLSGSDTTDVIAAGGKVVTLNVPKLQNVIGLTDSEADRVFAAATDCILQLASLDKTARPVILEARFQQLESGSVQPPVAQQVKAYEALHAQIILAHAGAIKTALGDARFQVLDQYVIGPGRKRSDLALSQPAAVK